jgi:hypothetical protein
MYGIFNPPGFTYWKPETTTHTERYCSTGVKNGKVLRGIRKNLGYTELYCQIVPNMCRACSDISLRYALHNQNRISRPHSPTPSSELSTEIDDLELVLEGVEVEVEMSEECVVENKENEDLFASVQAPYTQFVAPDSPVYTPSSQSEALASPFEQPPRINLPPPSSHPRGISPVRRSPSPLHTVDEIIPRRRTYQKERTRLRRKVHHKKRQEQRRVAQEASGEVAQRDFTINFGTGNSTVHIGQLTSSLVIHQR